MGIDFCHTRPDDHYCPQWSYGGFNHFRVALAAAEGFDLEEMQGFGKGGYFDGTRVHGTRPWEEIVTPLKPLLNHSDCDGELSPAECAQVAPRLREVATGWTEDTPEGCFDRRAALRLAECMDICAEAGEALVFC